MSTHSPPYRVQLNYFRVTGKFLAYAETTIAHVQIAQIWEEVHEMRRLGRLPGLRVNAGRDLFIIVDVPEHPERVLHLVMPPIVDDDDVTPTRVPTGEMAPLVRIHLDEGPRTSTRDVLPRGAIDPIEKPSHTLNTDDEVTPVDVPIPGKLRDE
jgi:hypothetical protein